MPKFSGELVVTRGAASGPFLIHQTRYSALNQTQGGPSMSGGGPGQAIGGGGDGAKRYGAIVRHGSGFHGSGGASGSSGPGAMTTAGGGRTAVGLCCRPALSWPSVALAHHKLNSNVPPIPFAMLGSLRP